jgi:hypothetical protein
MALRTPTTSEWNAMPPLNLKANDPEAVARMRKALAASRTNPRFGQTRDAERAEQAKAESR